LIGVPLQARFRKLLSDMGETFWLLPAAMVALAIVLALGLVSLDKSGVVPDWMVNGPWLYSGGAPGARTLLGAVAASTIGVAGTVFSITIAALSLAAGQMGPRLLRNFTLDRGNQFTLGAFLGTHRIHRPSQSSPYRPTLSARPCDPKMADPAPRRGSCRLTVWARSRRG